MSAVKNKIMKAGNQVKNILLKKREGIDGILVAVGLCIVALLLCVVMKDSLKGLIETITEALKNKAISILG